jgi:hypothetical protein
MPYGVMNVEYCKDEECGGAYRYDLWFSENIIIHLTKDRQM